MPSLCLALACVLTALAQAPQPGPSDERARWSAIAAHCGEELLWAVDWPDAARRAREEHRPVLCVAWLYADLDVPDDSRTVLAMDPDFVALANARCVPLRLTHASAAPFFAQDRYGLSPTAFGSALLLVTAEGDVVADSPFWQPRAARDFLARTLAAHPEFPCGAPPAGLERAERAAWLLARGELAAAAAELGSDASAQASLVRARLARLSGDGDGARAALRDARKRLNRSAHDDLAAELDLLEVLLALERLAPEEAREPGERLLRERPERDEGLAAAYLLGLADRLAGQRAAGEERWRALVAREPTSRWTWAAAAALLDPRQVMAELAPERSSPEILAVLRPVSRAPAGADTKKAVAAALEWLRTHRREDGTWLDATELDAGNQPWNAISLAIDTLSVRALLAHRGAGKLDLASETKRALTAARASLAERSDEPSYMTYEVWSDALALELVADLLAAGARDADGLRELGAALAQALAARQRTNGGWSYFEAASLDANAGKLEQSISFVTASVVLALQRAADAGVDLDGAGLERGVDALEAMRSDGGVFSYMLWSHERRAHEEPVPGAAGRAPLCELALLRAGRSTPERLHAALDQFFAHADTLAREAGKALMHAGADGQGCHYVLYDYASVARALAALPEAERAPYRARLHALLDGTRRADGAYVDTDFLGPASGTALALLAFAALDA